ncbi:MAG TPA: LTA synthase family protein [Nocardioidaceae bacterium]|nr:LTA synthase family protein [Nocardioidaceae bacterium]
MGPFLLGSALVWVLLMLVLCLTGRLWLSLTLLTLVTVVVAYANFDKIRLRLEPLYPSDLDFAGHGGFLVHEVGARTLAMMVTLLVLLSFILLMTGRLIRRVFPGIKRRDLPRLWAAVTSLRVVGVVACVAMLAYATNFNAPGNKLRAAYDASGAHWAFWYQKLNYQENGFVAGILYNLHVKAMDRPADYSAATMQHIVDKYTRRAAEVNKTRSPGALDDVNVVSILSEAFSDPTRVKGAHISQDPIPFTRNLMKHTTSGLMLAQLFGGGTANMEFETLTGMSLAQFTPQMTTPYQMMVPHYKQWPSAVGYFKQHGHDPIAIHPYMTGMYKRNEVYPILGFTKFVHDTTMQRAKKLDKSDFISDQSAFHEVEYQIGKSHEPLFINLVTMQNHYPMKNLYYHPIPVTGLKGEPKAEAEGYSRGINFTDQALKRFLTSLEHSNEKTIVVFYGDHLPAFWPKSIRDENGVRRMRETDFFVWSNFLSHQSNPQPTTSPIYFMPKIFDMANAPLPPYYELLDEMNKQIPAMEQGRYINADNRQVSESQLSSKAKQLLHDYRLVQYDLSVGKRYSQAGLFYPQTPSKTALAASK